jgi:hypothetical protein
MTVSAHKQIIVPYVYREFPKMIIVDGKQVIVDDAGEEESAWEAAGLAQPKEESVDDLNAQIEALKAMLASKGAAVDERSEMIAEAAKRGIEVDKRWSTERIRSALAA